MPYRVRTSLALTDAERAELSSWARRRKTAQGLALRARIVLLAADGLSNTAIAAELATDKHTVGKWRERFGRLRSDRLLDEPRSGAPRRIGDEQVAELIDRTLSERPAGASHWSLRSIAQVSGLSGSTVGREESVFRRVLAVLNPPRRNVLRGAAGVLISAPLAAPQWRVVGASMQGTKALSQADGRRLVTSRHRGARPGL